MIIKIDSKGRQTHEDGPMPEFASGFRNYCKKEALLPCFYITAINYTVQA